MAIGKYAKIVVAVVGGISTILAGLTGMNNYRDSPNHIKRQRVYNYFNAWYFPMAQQSPGDAWELLTTPDFKGLGIGEPVQFSRFWSSVEEVKDLRVFPENEDQRNQFDIEYVVVYKKDGLNGRSQPEKIRLRVDVVCDGFLRTYTPIFRCRSDLVRLDDAQLVTQ